MQSKRNLYSFGMFKSYIETVIVSLISLALPYLLYLFRNRRNKVFLHVSCKLQDIVFCILTSYLPRKRRNFYMINCFLGLISYLKQKAMSQL
jgi:hypothetical protein